MIKLRENRGVLLISTFAVAAVISVISGAYLASSLAQNQSVQRQKDSMQAFYAAEAGIEYAFIESQNRGWMWATHQAETDTDNDGDTDPNELLPRQAGVPIPTLDRTAIINTQDCPGCYEINLPSGQRIQVKAYADPARPDETLVLSRNTTDSASRIIKYRINRRSLYQYFLYYPGDTILRDMQLDGKDTGGIYVNGNIGLGHSTFTRITELSTNKDGKIFLEYGHYNSPYELDISRGKMDGYAPLPYIGESASDPHIYSRDNPYPWKMWNWPPYNWPPIDWRNVDYHFRDEAATINGVELPRDDLPSPWYWDKYASPASADEKPVQFVDKDGKVPSEDYWDKLRDQVFNGTEYGYCNRDTTCLNNYFDEDFWPDKTYRRGIGKVEVNYLDTDKQAKDWVNWLSSTGGGHSLSSIVHEKSTGGYNIAPLNIQLNYTDLAQKNGIYINQEWPGRFEVWVNGKITNRLPEWITDTTRFYNTVRPKIDNSDYPVKERVLELDIAKMESPPNNGIIYIANQNLRLINGSKLPRDLTIVSPYNIYIKGNYNYDPETQDAWKPAAVISNSYVYLLSDDFNDPKNLPGLSRPREYPAELSVKPHNSNMNIAQYYYTWESNTNPRIREVWLRHLKNAVKSSFKLNSFDYEPASIEDFLNNIRTEYYNEYALNKNPPSGAALMPNLASDTTYQVAIATPYDPKGYVLERWADKDPVTDEWREDTKRSLNLVGAFIKLEKSWANKEDGSPINDVPAEYMRSQRNTPVWINDPNSKFIYPTLEYEERFVNNRRPSGDFFVASQVLWEEVSDFNHNT